MLQSRRCGSQPDPPRGATTPLWSLWCKALPQNQALSTGGVVSCSSLVFFDTLGYRSLKFALAYPERMAEQRGAAALAEVQGMFPHLMPAQAAADAPMEPAPLTKPRATGKGGGGQGSSAVATGQRTEHPCREEWVRLLARVSMRHEDELSQHRAETYLVTRDELRLCLCLCLCGSRSGGASSLLANSGQAYPSRRQECGGGLGR